MKVVRKCNYEHCNKCIDDMRPNAKFCSSNHRKMKGVLQKRYKKKREKLFDMLVKAKELSEQPTTIIGLFEKIYRNK